MANIKIIGMDKLIRTMKKAEANLPIVRMQTLNNMADHAWGLTQGPSGTIDRSFDLRNGYTQGSVFRKKANRSPKSVSMVGSVQDYMRVQELGQSNYDVGHVATDDARISKNHGKRVTRRRKLSKQNFGDAGPTVRGNRAAYIRIKQAQRKGEKGPFRMIITGKHGTQEGLYLLAGRGGKDLRMIHNVSKEKVDIKQKPWLMPAALGGQERGLKFFIRNFQRFLKNG